MSAPRQASVSNSLPIHSPVGETEENLRAGALFHQRVASALTALVGLVLLLVGVISLAQGHGKFSVGVGSMLVIYGLFVGLLAFGGWRGWDLANGPIVGAAVLHTCVVISLANNGAPWVLVALLVLLPTIVFGVLARVRTAKANKLEEAEPTSR